MVIKSETSKHKFQHYKNDLKCRFKSTVITMILTFGGQTAGALAY